MNNPPASWSWRSAIAAALSLVGFALPALAQDRPQSSPPFWSVANVSAAPKTEITVISQAGPPARGVPLSGKTFLEVRGLIAGKKVAAVVQDSVYAVVGRSAEQAQRFTITAIGTVGRDGSCMYSQFNLLTGAISEAVEVSNESGDGYKVYRDQGRGPVLIALKKNPNQTCLVFAVPEGAGNALFLHFGDAHVAISATIVASAPAPETPVTPQVVTGLSHTCALDARGRAYCWGWNDYRELGDGSALPSPSPMGVAGGFVFTQLTAGAHHTCGLTSQGKAYCWGYVVIGARPLLTNSPQEGPLGEPHASPVLVGSGLTFTQLAAGAYHTCGIASDGFTYCWGYNVQGQLGSGNTDSRFAALTVGIMKFTQITAGSEHTCGLTATAHAYCWGDNAFGQLGDGSTTRHTSPIRVSGEITFVQLAAGGTHTCGLTAAGAAYCWGRNDRAQLGAGSTTPDNAQPISVGGNLVFTQLSAGMNHTCGLAGTGRAYCWGLNKFGQLGDGSTTNRPQPVAVGSRSFVRLAAGNDHTCGVTSEGQTFCWGSNDHWELADKSSTKPRLSPVLVIARPVPEIPSRTSVVSVGKAASGGLKECILVSMQRRGDDKTATLSGAETRTVEVPAGNYVISVIIGKNDMGELVLTRILVPLESDHKYSVSGRFVKEWCSGNTCRGRLIALVKDVTTGKEVPAATVP